MSSIVTIAAKSRPLASPLVAQPTTGSRLVVSEGSDSIGHAEGTTSDTDCARGCERGEPVEIPTRFLRSRYAVCSDGRLDYQYSITIWKSRSWPTESESWRRICVTVALVMHQVTISVVLTCRSPSRGRRTSVIVSDAACQWERFSAGSIRKRIH